ncbi:MAG TPA: hypothetical protein VGV07_19065 [Devosia sp.]|uniref:hypothetical protein n=1 Tax=Devosia sp. TaxID=1871048 RepID=UPI002DDDA9AD|nr:hypothetical protein [Devosia sp.]HEV2517361.1 hypothetical protein [Devosia sp.]
MAHISAPGHDDCYVDCHGQGYAHYIEPYGPCLTGCTEGDLVSSLEQVFPEAEPDQRASGRVFEVRGMTLVRVAEHFSSRFDGSDDAAEDVEWLTQLAGKSRDARFDANWEDEDLAGVIRALAEAAGKRPRPRMAFA